MPDADDELAGAEAARIRAVAAKTAAEAELIAAEAAKLRAEAAKATAEAERATAEAEQVRSGARHAAAPPERPAPGGSRFWQERTRAITLPAGTVFRQHEVRWEALQTACESLADGIDELPENSRVLVTADENLLRSLVVYRRLDWSVDMLIASCGVALDEPQRPLELAHLQDTASLLFPQGALTSAAPPQHRAAIGVDREPDEPESTTTSLLGADGAVAAAAAGATALKEITALFTSDAPVESNDAGSTALDAQLALLAALTVALPEVRFLHDSFRSMSTNSPLVRKVSILTARLGRLRIRAKELEDEIAGLPSRKTEDRGRAESELGAVRSLIQAVVEFMTELSAPASDGAVTPLLVALSGEQISSGAPFTHAMLVPAATLEVDQVLIKRAFLRPRITVTGSAQVKFLLISLLDGGVVQAGSGLGVSGYTVKFGRKQWTEWRREATLAESATPWEARTS